MGQVSRGAGWTVKRSLAWWSERQRVKPYLFLAEDVDRRIDPTSARFYGSNRSAVLRPNVRTYAFEKEAHRDKFCKFTGAMPVTVHHFNGATDGPTLNQEEEA